LSTQHTPRVALVTGGCGFIGANYVRWLLTNDPTVRVVNLDLLTYAGHAENTAGMESTGRYAFVQGDIADEGTVRRVFAEHRPDTVVHFAAESHVDRSIDAPGAFLRTNVMGTFVLLQAARAAWGDREDVRFHAVSTDEVFGSLGESGFFTEATPYDPSSPYSASKASADHLVRAWHRTFGLPITLSNCSNNYGPYQFPEKLVPLMILKALARQPLPVYGDGQNVRDWLYVVDHCEAIDTIVRRARTGETYLVSGANEWKNLDIVHRLCDLLDELDPGATSRRACITFVKDRPGHDRRYAIDASRLKQDLGWEPRYDFERGIRATIRWYLDHGEWISAVTGGKYALERLGLG
jgi:dTDP-glucose 4,6-dehydratase